MWSQTEISQAIRSALLVLDPEVSLIPGTPERKIVDSVSSVLASVQVDKFVSNYSLDINSKVGTDLDDFVALFGFSRIAAQPSVGYVTFIRNTPAPAPVFIPAGTLLSAPSTNTNAAEISFRTLTDAVMATNDSTIDVLIQCAFSGSIGNVPSNSITSVVQTGANAGTLTNVNSVTNYLPLTGGSDPESDEELVVRFQNTIFRNINGTNDQFLALALANSGTNKAILIGPSSTFSEYMQIPSSGFGTSTNTSAQYVYNTNYFLSSNGNDTGVFYIPGSDYTFYGGTVGSPVAVTLSNGNLAPLIEFADVVNPVATAIPTVATYGAGNVSGAVVYGYTYVYNPGGESTLGTAISLPISGTTNTIQLSGVATANVIAGTAVANLIGGTVITRNIYRSTDGVNFGYVGTLNDNINTTYYDNALITTTSPPTNTLGTGNITYLQYRYLSHNSRNYVNDLTQTSVINKIDVYISSNGDQYASDVVLGPGVGFSPSSVSPYNYKNYIRGYSNFSTGGTINNAYGSANNPNAATAYPYTHPGTANSFIQLTWTPVVSLPETINVNGTTFYQGDPVTGTALNGANRNGDFYFVRDISTLRGSINAREGMEVGTAMAAAIGSVSFPINYFFNNVPLVTQELINQHTQVGQDVLIHQADYRYFRTNFNILYTNGFGTSSVNQQIATDINNYFNSLTFDAVIEPSAVLQSLYSVNGITAIQYSGTADSTVHYGIEEVDVYGNTMTFWPTTSAIFLQDTEVPLFYDLGPNGPNQKAINTWH